MEERLTFFEISGGCIGDKRDPLKTYFLPFFTSIVEQREETQLNANLLCNYDKSIRMGQYDIKVIVYNCINYLTSYCNGYFY